MASLEKSSQEQSEKVRLLEAQVEALEQDNSALKDKAFKLQEKAKAAAKEKKGILFLLCCLCFLSSFFCAHILFALIELKRMNW